MCVLHRMMKHYPFFAIQALLLLLYLGCWTCPTADGVNTMSGWMEERSAGAIKCKSKTIGRETTKFGRWKQRFIDPNFGRNRWQSSSRRRRRQGTFLTVQSPTPERLSLWFGTISRRPNNDIITCSNNTSNDDTHDWLLSFNHPHVGLTNPFVRTMAVSKTLPADDFSSPTNDSKSKEKKRNSDSTNDYWWPETACSNASSATAKQWRVLCFRRCNVGQGRACYQRVRDAALAWEFASDSKGILQVPITANDAATTSETSSSIGKQEPQQGYENDNDDRSGLQSLIMGQQGRRRVFDDDSNTPTVPTAASGSLSSMTMRCWPEPRRSLATYTSIRLVPRWLSRFVGDRKLYCLNPVHVVYDWVDQCGGDSHSSTLYTSTAYATGKGHWLCGEERVTVAMRENGRVDVELLSFSKPAKSFMGWFVWPIIGKMQTTFFLQELEALEHLARAYKQP